jgi:glycosyltransferase involved in cell wall biosynthesis
MTAYNREKYIAEAIESVLAQTFRDFELIIVDDRSHDRSAEAAKHYEIDLRVKVHVNEKNLGDYSNRNRAASFAEGKYLKYVDSDDILYHHSLAIMVEAMEAHPDAALALSHTRREDEQPYPWKLTPVEAYRKEFLARGCLSSGPSGAIFLSGTFEGVGGFGNWGVLNDIDLWYRMAGRWPVVLLPPGLVWWRRHEQQEFSKDNAAMIYLERGFALTMETLFSPECPLAESERQAALTRARQHYARRLLSLAIRSREPLRAWQLFLKSGLGFRGLVRGLHRFY